MRRTSYVPLQTWHNREKTMHPHGYVLVKVPEHPKSFRGGWYYEHRLVAEARRGRILPSWITVHHINNDKTFNVWENLFPCTRLEHDYAT